MANSIEKQSPKLRVAGYARIGKPGAFTGCLETEIQFIKELIERNPEWEFMGIYADEGYSGKDKNRISFTQMLHDAEEHKFDCIAVKNIRKFSLDTVEATKAIRRLSEAGIKVFFINDGMSSDDERFKLQFTLMCAIEEKERELLSLKRRQKKD